MVIDDLISRRVAIKDICDLPNCDNGYSDTYDKACIIGVLEEQQPIDAVPVVRCRDCKDGPVYDGIYRIRGECEFGDNGDDFFCAYGEKRAKNEHTD